MDILSFYVGSRRHFSETSLTGTDHTMSCGFCRVSFDKLINDSVRHNSSFRERARSRNTYFPFCGSFEYLMVFCFRKGSFQKMFKYCVAFFFVSISSIALSILSFISCPMQWRFWHAYLHDTKETRIWTCMMLYNYANTRVSISMLEHNTMKAVTMVFKVTTMLSSP